MATKRGMVVIEPKKEWFNFNLKELYEYRDLVWMFVKRNMAIYKQTVLGPLWIILKPLFMSLMFAFVYGRMLGLGTDTVPALLFYMSGNIVWTFFSTCVTDLSKTFVTNSNIFSKVYFPRLAAPVSTVIFQGISFLVQLVVFIVIEVYYIAIGAVHPNIWLLIVPALIIETGLVGMAGGLILSAITIKYRDLQVFATFGIQLMMYLCPVIYSASKYSLKLKIVIFANPISSVIETFRYAFFGTGEVPIVFLLIGFVITALLLLLGMMLFSRAEKTVIDVV